MLRSRTVGVSCSSHGLRYSSLNGTQKTSTRRPTRPAHHSCRFQLVSVCKQNNVCGKLARANAIRRLRVSNSKYEANSSTEQAVQVAAVKSEEDPSPYFDGFLRSFLLGLGVGCLFETCHVMLQVSGLIQQTGFSGIAQTVQASLDQFSPLFVQDHVAAIGSWVLLYGIEVVTILSILNRYPNDGEAAAKALSRTVTLPRKMLPVRLQIFKRLLLSSSAMPALATASTGVADQKPTARSWFSPLLNRFVDAPVGDKASIPSTAGNVVPPTVALPKEVENVVVPSPAPQKESDDLATKRKHKGLKPGQWDISQSTLAKRQKELADRKSYLRNFWYAAALADSVGTDEPHGVEVLGQKLVLFRDTAGVVHCISDVCPHRGAPLHKGWVTEKDGHNCVVCPYHGWAVDTQGYLRDVPAAERRGEWPSADPVVEAYPVEEKGGFIWLFYGSPGFPVDERPPIPFVPELEDPTWKPVYGEIEFDCNHWGVFENAIDMAHIHYLHSDTFGNQDQPEIRGMHCETDMFSVTATFQLHNKPVNAMWEWSKVPAVEVTAKAFLPSTSVISFTLGNGLSFTTFVNTVPVNANKTINRFALVRNISWDKTGLFNMDAWDQMAREAMIRILSEDREMVQQLRPDLLPREISVKADLPQIAFRKLRQSFIDMGYGVLPEQTMERFRNDF